MRRPPPIAAVTVDPRAGHVEAAAALRRRRLDSERRRGLRQQRRILVLRIAPVTGHPPPAVVRLGIAARHPDTARRRLAPEAADPRELLLLGVPLPVTGDPLRLVPRGLFLRRL